MVWGFRFCPLGFLCFILHRKSRCLRFSQTLSESHCLCRYADILLSWFFLLCFPWQLKPGCVLSSFRRVNKASRREIQGNKETAKRDNWEISTTHTEPNSYFVLRMTCFRLMIFIFIFQFCVSIAYVCKALGFAFLMKL